MTTWLSGIHDFGYLFQRVGGAGSAAYKGDWTGFALNVAAAGGKYLWYKKAQDGALKAALDKCGKSILPTPTAILDVTIVAVSVVDLLNGIGPAESGASFGTGADKYELIYKSLQLATPDSRDWDGEAAQAFAAQIATLQALVKEIEDIDKQMQTLVAQQGQEITSAHNFIASTLLALVIAQGVALAMYLIPVFGPDISCFFQVMTAGAATIALLIKEAGVMGSANQIAPKVDALGVRYTDVATKAQLPGSFTTITVNPTDDVKVGSFSAISESLSSFTAPPTVAMLAAKATTLTSPQHYAALDALSDTPGAEPAPIGAAADSATGTPAITGASLLSQITQGTGQLGKISNNLAQPLNVINQTMGSVQQVVSMASQSGQTGSATQLAGANAPAEPPADPPADPLDTDTDTGAAAGTDSGERAPVDLAAEQGARGDDTPGAQRLL